MKTFVIYFALATFGVAGLNAQTTKYDQNTSPVFPAFGPGCHEKQQLGSHLHRTLSSRISQARLSRVTFANREEGPGYGS